MINPTFKAIKISDLNNISQLSSTDIFIFSDANPSIPKTYVEEYSHLSADVLHKLELSGNFNPDGTWKFGSNNHYIRVLQTPSAGTDAITLKYNNDNYIEKVNWLRGKLFNTVNTELSIPSFVGMVIITDLDNHDDILLSMYGANTRWRQIQGRFLLAAGYDVCSNNLSVEQFGRIDDTFKVRRSNILGGEERTELDVKNIPPHRHCFNGVNNTINKFPALHIDSSRFPGEADPKTVSGACQYDTSHSIYWKHRHKSKGQYPSGADAFITMPTGSYEKEFTFKVNGEIAENVDTAHGIHNNMPPYVKKYIWERIV